MLQRLRKSIFQQKWSLLIVDESHHVRCAKKSSEPEEVFIFGFLLDALFFFQLIEISFYC